MASFPLEDPESTPLRLDEDEPSFLTDSLLLLSLYIEPLPRLEVELSLLPLSLISPLNVLEVDVLSEDLPDDLLDDLVSTF